MNQSKENKFDNIFSKNHLNLLLVIFFIAIFASFISIFFFDKFVFSSLKKNPLSTHVTYRSITFLGKVIIPVWLLCLWFSSTSHIKGITIAILALLLVAPSVSLTKSVIRRPRPRDIMKADWTDAKRNNPFRSWSFPSGDTASIFAVVTALSAFVSWYWRPGLFFLAAMVGFMRITCFAHYPSDVFAGAGFGILCAWFAIIIARKKINFDELSVTLFRKVAFICLILIPFSILFFQGHEEFSIFIKSYFLPSILFYFIIQIEKAVKGNTFPILTHGN